MYKSDQPQRRQPTLLGLSRRVAAVRGFYFYRFAYVYIVMNEA